MKNRQTHALGVPLRTEKPRNQVLIGAVVHAYDAIAWVKAMTLCGICYTHKKYLAGSRVMLATRTSRAVDCMACLVKETSR